jgi:predicted secreted hydrolase
VEYAKDRWTWFSIQLEDGTDIMCVEYDDGKEKDRFVDLVDGRGHASHIQRVTFTPGQETWKSKVTKASYPLSWTITIPEKEMVITTSALLADQEMIFGAINYWEGPVSVSATVGGKKVNGVGFMELAGYPSNYSFLLLAGKKVNARVQEEVAARIKGFLG